MRIEDLEYTIKTHAKNAGVKNPNETYIRFFVINEFGEKKQVFVEDTTFLPADNTFELLLG